MYLPTCRYITHVGMYSYLPISRMHDGRTYVRTFIWALRAVVDVRRHVFFFLDEDLFILKYVFALMWKL